MRFLLKQSPWHVTSLFSCTKRIISTSTQLCTILEERVAEYHRVHAFNLGFGKYSCEKCLGLSVRSNVLRFIRATIILLSSRYLGSSCLATMATAEFLVFFVPLPIKVCDVSDRAVWCLSSCKSNHGINELLNESLDTYWQSDGPQPHTVTVQFPQKTIISEICLYNDYKVDESYTPSR